MIIWYFGFVLLKGKILQRVARVAKHPVYELCVAYVTWYWRIVLSNGSSSKRLIMKLIDLEHRITYIVVNKTHIDCLNLWLELAKCRE